MGFSILVLFILPQFCKEDFNQTKRLGFISPDCFYLLTVLLSAVLAEVVKKIHTFRASSLTCFQYPVMMSSAPNALSSEESQGSVPHMGCCRCLN